MPVRTPFLRSANRQIEAVELHHLHPGSDEVGHEFLLATRAASSTPTLPASTVRSASDTCSPPACARLNSACTVSSAVSTRANRAGSLAAQPRNGFALDTDGAAEIVQCLQWLRADPARDARLRRAAAETAAMYTWPDVIDRLTLALGLAGER